MSLPILALLVVTSSAADAAPYTPPGEDLAHRLSIELAGDKLSEFGAVDLFLQLDAKQRRIFLSTWKVLRGDDSAFRKHADEPQRLVQMDRLPPLTLEQKVTYEADKKSLAGAWALSFFIGLGIGNFYVDADAWGVAVLIGEVLTGVATIAALSAGDPDFIALAFVGNRIIWALDWGGALNNAEAYNNSLERSMRSGAASFTYTFEF